MGRFEKKTGRSDLLAIVRPPRSNANGPKRQDGERRTGGRWRENEAARMTQARGGDRTRKVCVERAAGGSQRFRRRRSRRSGPPNAHERERARRRASGREIQASRRRGKMRRSAANSSPPQKARDLQRSKVGGRRERRATSEIDTHEFNVRTPKKTKCSKSTATF